MNGVKTQDHIDLHHNSQDKVFLYTDTSSRLHTDRLVYDTRLYRRLLRNKFDCYFYTELPCNTIRSLDIRVRLRVQILMMPKL